MKIDKNDPEYQLRYNELLVFRRKHGDCWALVVHPRKSWSMEEVEEAIEKIMEQQLVKGR